MSSRKTLGKQRNSFNGVFDNKFKEKFLVYFSKQFLKTTHFDFQGTHIFRVTGHSAYGIPFIYYCEAHLYLSLLGMDQEYDGAVAEVKNMQKQLDQYIEEQKNVLSCRVR